MADTLINDDKSGDDFSIGHKFKAINNQFWDSLKESEVYFASPETLNDPFDCQIELVKARKLSLITTDLDRAESEEGRWREIANYINQKARACGVFSLSGGKIVGSNSQLLWSHYGDNHKGICLTYRIPTSFVLREMIGISQVEYKTEKLFFALSGLSLLMTPTFEEITPIITALLTTKSDIWKYEQEFRLVAFKSGPQKIERAWLAQICFGLRVNSSTKQATMSAMKDWGYKECKFAEVYIPNDGLLDLAIRELEAT